MQILQGVVVGVAVVLITQFMQSSKSKSAPHTTKTGGGVLASAETASEQIYV